jgi:hypothetical protein
MATIALGTSRGSPGKESYDEHLHRRLSNRWYCNRFVWNACSESPKAGYYLGESFRSATKNSSTPVDQKNSFFDPETSHELYDNLSTPHLCKSAKKAGSG